jgi:hypothetical protein
MHSQVKNVKTGHILHEQHFMANKEFSKDRPSPPVINLRCYDIVGGAPGLHRATCGSPFAVMISLRVARICGCSSDVNNKPGGLAAVTIVRVQPDMAFSDVLDLLEKTYGQKTLFEYQDQGGRVC